MELLRFFLRFFFRHLIWFILGPLAVGVMVYVYSKTWVDSFEVTTTVYTGVTTNTSTGDGTSINAEVANTNLENLITIIRSRATLERVSLRLFAQSMIYGDPEKDNLYISASTFRRLNGQVPDVIKALIDKSSVDKTVENFFNYLKPDRKNYLYGILNWFDPYFSIDALRNIIVNRVPGTDMLDISYTCTDPAIAFQTLELLNKEFIYIFSELRYKDSNEIIHFFEQEVAASKALLGGQEDSLLQYNMKRRVVNYDKQTEGLTLIESDQFISMKSLLMQLASSQSALVTLDAQLKGRASAFVNNTNFMSLMKDISELSASIVAAESLMPDTLKVKDPQLQSYKKEMERLTQQLKATTQEIRYSQDTKEGVSSERVVDEWLTEKVTYEKAKASIEQLDKQRAKLDEMYIFYSPIGANLTRKERDINVSASSYLQLTQALISARLRLKNLQMSLGNVSVVTPPVYPLGSLPTQRRILVYASMLAAFIFILCYFLIIELIDNTLKTVFRSEKLIDESVDGVVPWVYIPASSAFPVTKQENAALLASTIHLAILLTHKLTPGQKCWITFGSTHTGDGKSLLCRLLDARFSELGYQVAWIRPGMDYAINTKSYFAAETADDLLKTGKFPIDTSAIDLFLVELPSTSNATYPGQLLAGAATNVMVCDAYKGWHFAEKEVLKQFKELSRDNIKIVLNRVSMDDVEMFTGLLPPKTWIRKLRFRIMNLELTSRWNT